MNNSILNDIKKLLGIDAEYDAFDQDLIIHINTVLMLLNQLGVGPDSCYSITGATETWADFLGSDTSLEMVKTYIYLRVKQMFDPSLSGSVSGIYDAQIKELEWRLQIQLDNSGEETTNGVDDSE